MDAGNQDVVGMRVHGRTQSATGNLGIWTGCHRQPETQTPLRCIPGNQVVVGSAGVVTAPAPGLLIFLTTSALCVHLSPARSAAGAFGLITSETAPSRVVTIDRASAILLAPGAAVGPSHWQPLCWAPATARRGLTQRCALLRCSRLAAAGAGRSTALTARAVRGTWSWRLVTWPEASARPTQAPAHASAGKRTLGIHAKAQRTRTMARTAALQQDSDLAF